MNTRNLHDFFFLCQEFGRHRRVWEEYPIRERNNQSHPTRQQEEDPPGLEGTVQSDLQDRVGEKTGDDLCARRGRGSASDLSCGEYESNYLPFIKNQYPVRTYATTGQTRSRDGSQFYHETHSLFGKGVPRARAA